MGYAYLKAQKELFSIIALLLIGATGGYTVSGIYNAPVDPHTQEINVRVSEVNVMMADLIENPSYTAAENVNYNLRLQGDWSNRNYGDHKEDFESYLEACNDVVISISRGELKQSDIDKMNSLYSKLN